MIKTKRIKYVLGSIIAIPLKHSDYIFAIPLESMKYAYAKTHKDGNLGIYNFISDVIVPLEEVVKHPIIFYQYGTDKAIKNGLWPILGALTFASEDNTLLPPMATCYDRDSNTWTMSEPKIYHNGESYFVTEKEVHGLDIFGVAISPEAIVHVITDRLIRGNHDYYKVRG